jgi:pyruvate formate-lyase activating enzyme-like uncharacterized protein
MVQMAKDIFRKAKGVTATGAKVVGGKPSIADRKNVGSNLSKGLGKLISGG